MASTWGSFWVYHNLWSELNTGGSVNLTTGGSLPGGVPYLKSSTNENAFRADPFHAHKIPAFVRFQTMLSFVSRKISDEPEKYRLAVVADPLVTLWNPTDVTLDLTDTWFSSKFWALPYDVKVTSDGNSQSVANFADMFGYTQGNSNPQNHYLTLRAGTGGPFALKPGEVVVYSQGGGAPVDNNAGLSFINGKPGFNFSGGIRADYRSKEEKFIEGPGSTRFSYAVEANGLTATAGLQWTLTGHGVYFKEDRQNLDTKPDLPPGGKTAESVGIGAFNVDGLRADPYSRGNEKPAGLRLYATNSELRPFFGEVTGRSGVTLESVSSDRGNKRPFMLYSFLAKTEDAAKHPGRYAARLNPRLTGVDFFNLSKLEQRMLPFEVQVKTLNGSTDPLLDVSNDGGGFFGGGWDASSGSPVYISYSVPRQPPVSLAAFQHSMANGVGFSGFGGPTSSRFLHPEINHAIGNSMACPLIEKDKTEGEAPGPRPLADHSYLANEALWDDWFLSGISPETAATFTTKRTQQQVATDFFEDTGKLPNRHYKAVRPSEPVADLVSRLLPATPFPAGAEGLGLSAAHISVEGMFNVNSVSVEAWKAVLGALREKDVLGQEENGSDKPIPAAGLTPVSSIQTPIGGPIDRNTLTTASSRPQYSGIRTLSETEIGELATAIVAEVRERGPFLSLADFVNRRRGSDARLAKSGAIQAALDSDSVSINSPYLNGLRLSKGDTDGLLFPEAEEGAAAYGIPGYVKQADILTPIAATLSARSDTFVIRGYGEALSTSGKAVSKAICEAVVKRGAEFTDPSDASTTAFGNLTETNKTFGRKFRIVSFRWLHSSEI